MSRNVIRVRLGTVSVNKTENFFVEERWKPVTVHAYLGATAIADAMLRASCGRRTAIALRRQLAAHLATFERRKSPNTYYLMSGIRAWAFSVTQAETRARGARKHDKRV